MNFSGTIVQKPRRGKASVSMMIDVPGDKPWTKKQIQHQAMQIATIAKLNGGAVCGRIQTIITSKNWEQREEFLKELTNALEHETPAVGSYYSGTEDVIASFQENHPEAKVLEPENGKFKKSKFILIEGVKKDSYAVKNEAFCQITSEVALDTPAKADSFLPEGKEFLSGCGNFGNVLCFENVEKSIAYSGFMSSGHIINANKKANYSLSENMAKYAVGPSWRRIMGMMRVAIGSKFKGKDF